MDGLGPQLTCLDMSVDVSVNVSVNESVDVRGPQGPLSVQKSQINSAQDFSWGVSRVSFSAWGVEAQASGRSTHEVSTDRRTTRGSTDTNSSTKRSRVLSPWKRSSVTSTSLRLCGPGI